MNPSGRSRWAAGSTPPERSSVHHYAGENRPTLRMPSAQLRELIISLIEPEPTPPRIDAAIELGARRDANDITSVTAQGAVLGVAHSVPIGVVNGVPLDSVDIEVPLDTGPSIRTHPRPDTASDNASVYEDHTAGAHALDHALAHALDEALVSLDAIDDAIDDSIDDAIDDRSDDALDDFEAQPTAYRVRTATIDDAIAPLSSR